MGTKYVSVIKYILVKVFRINLKLFEKQIYVIIKTVLKKYINLMKKIRNTITIGQLLDIILSLTFTFIRCPRILIVRWANTYILKKFLNQLSSHNFKFVTILY